MGRGLVELSESWSRGEEQDVGEEGSRKGLELNVSRKQIRLKAINFTNPTDDRPLETRNSWRLSSQRFTGKVRRTCRIDNGLQ